jgi:hypothetical protein
VFLDKYFKSLREDIESTERALTDQMPLTARRRLEHELRALHAMNRALAEVSRPVTKEQIRMLKKFNIDGTGLTRDEASEQISDVLKVKRDR